jgi:hypothetical protein
MDALPQRWASSPVEKSYSVAAAAGNFTDTNFGIEGPWPADTLSLDFRCECSLFVPTSCRTIDAVNDKQSKIKRSAMPERTTILSIVLAAAVAAGLAILPVSVKAQGEYSNPAGQSGKSGAKAKKSSSESKAPEVRKKEPTKGQLEARERQKKCGAEWRDAKAKGTLEKGITWPKYWSACNKRLKGQAA